MVGSRPPIPSAIAGSWLPGRPWALAALVALMAALVAAGTRIRVKEESRTREAPRERGVQYEDHVLVTTNLSATVAATGGVLHIYPRLYVPPTTLPARYYRSPTGYGGGAVRDRQPHRSAPSRWRAVDAGGYRIPDAIEHRADGSEVLYELKCPSPWLVFDSGNPWAGKMQATFASQAMAYFVWAAAAPRRSIVYGFCGLPPPWAVEILGDLRRRLHAPVEIRPAYRSVGFGPAQAFLGSALREAMTAAAVGAAADLAPDQLTGPLYDALKD